MRSQALLRHGSGEYGMRCTRRDLIPQLVVTLGALALVSPSAVAQGVGYTLLPSSSYVRWEPDLGLERALMFGGRAVTNFGPLIGLEGHYLLAGGVIARFSETGLTDSLGASLDDGTVDITNYGLGIRLSIGGSRLAPFLRAGGSVFRFDDGGRTGPRQIAVSYGGGIRIHAARRIRAELFAEDTRFRLDRSALARGATPGTDPQRDELRSNLTFGAGLGFAIGGEPASTAPRERWSVASVPLEPFVGRLDFADDALETQSLIGMRAGIDVRNYVGLRAYYLRGVSSGFSKLEGVRSLGGEAQFNLNAAPRFAPYLVVGGGTLDFQSDYRDTTGGRPADRTLLILGGGIGLRLHDKFRLNVAARDLLHGHDAGFGDVSQASELRHNWLYSAGVTMSVGRSRRGIALVRNDQRAEAAGDTTAHVALGDSVVRQDSVPQAGPTSRVQPANAMRDVTAAARVERDYHSTTSIGLPVPTEGEVYIRYGPSVTTESVSRGRVAGDTTGERPLRGLAADDTASLASTIGRMLSERWKMDSLLIRDLVALEVARWRADDARGIAERNPEVVTADPAPPVAAQPGLGEGEHLAALRADRDLARAEARRLQLRLDSLEARFRRDAAARVVEDSAVAQHAKAANLEDAARADSVAASRAADEIERRRYDALAVVERSIPLVTGVRDGERGLVIVLGNHLFPSGQHAVSDRARIELSGVATLMAEYPEARVIIAGHTDSLGAMEANQRLSAARAESVRNALIAHGIRSERVTARGYGETRPVADNATVEGRAQNRRAELIILGVRRPRTTSER